MSLFTSLLTWFLVVGLLLVVTWVFRRLSTDRARPSQTREDVEEALSLSGGSSAKQESELETEEFDLVKDYSDLGETIDELSVEEADVASLESTLIGFAEAENELLQQWRRRLDHQDVSTLDDKITLIQDLKDISDEFLALAQDNRGVEKRQALLERLLDDEAAHLDSLDDDEESLRSELQDENKTIKQALNDLDKSSFENEDLYLKEKQGMQDMLSSNRDSVQAALQARDKIDQAKQRYNAIKERLNDLEQQTTSFLDTMQDVQDDASTVLSEYNQDPDSEDVAEAAEKLLSTVSDDTAVKIEEAWSENIKEHNDIHDDFTAYKDLLEEIEKLVDVEIQRHHEH